MDHTSHLNSALKGRYHFFGHRRTRLQNEVVTEYKCETETSGSSAAQSRRLCAVGLQETQDILDQFTEQYYKEVNKQKSYHDSKDLFPF